ncbi:unnamed protein product [Nippostrongylus brasiliensis]|uniref:Col_cuticle_N domain-containing protein n=1 Tax=Nippostrongylus brasiliensis TaxID=27835 RepID=A0A0N4XE57_NIPBR|nr:unnamed protein product [Nippostrongylus brasiliensis]
MSSPGKLIETEAVKRFAFFGVTISTVSTLTAIVAVPMLCLYMQHIQSGLQDELNFCRSRGESVRAEYNKGFPAVFIATAGVHQMTLEAEQLDCFAHRRMVAHDELVEREGN